MKAEKPESSAKARQRQRALSSGEIEGGAGSSRPRRSPAAIERKAAVPRLGNAELVQLRIRVIALENLVIALLAESPDRRLEIAREMASYISPRPGFTPHRLTTRAAAQMLHLVERAGFFRVGGTPS
jgi:hypothetical protein